MFQRRQVVDLCSSANLDSESNIEEGANFFHKQLNSKKAFDRIFAVGKVSSVLKTYEQRNLKRIDDMLVKGMYKRSLND